MSGENIMTIGRRFILAGVVFSLIRFWKKHVHFGQGRPMYFTGGRRLEIVEPRLLQTLDSRILSHHRIRE